jgi:hypothetical protein
MFLSALDLIAELGEGGVQLVLEGEEITLKAQFKMQDAMVARVRENRYAIVELLRLSALAPPDANDLH